MNISTGKNQAVVDINTIRYAIWCYGFRFLPTIGNKVKAASSFITSAIESFHEIFVAKMMNKYLVNYYCSSN